MPTCVRSVFPWLCASGNARCNSARFPKYVPTFYAKKRDGNTPDRFFGDVLTASRFKNPERFHEFESFATDFSSYVYPGSRCPTEVQFRMAERGNPVQSGSCTRSGNTHSKPCRTRAPLCLRTGEGLGSGGGVRIPADVRFVSLLSGKKEGCTEVPSGSRPPQWVWGFLRFYRSAPPRLRC